MFSAKFATGVRHQQGDLREDGVRTRRAAKRCVQCISAFDLFVFLCSSAYEDDLNSVNSVFSGPVPRSVLSLRCGGAEWPVCINRRELREELRWLLIEERVQGHYLPRHFRRHPPDLSSFPKTISSPGLLTPLVQLMCLI